MKMKKIIIHTKF